MGGYMHAQGIWLGIYVKEQNLLSGLLLDCWLFITGSEPLAVVTVLELEAHLRAERIRVRSAEFKMMFGKH